MQAAIPRISLLRCWTSLVLDLLQYWQKSTRYSVMAVSRCVTT